MNHFTNRYILFFNFDTQLHARQHTITLLTYTIKYFKKQQTNLIGCKPQVQIVK